MKRLIIVLGIAVAANMAMAQRVVVREPAAVNRVVVPQKVVIVQQPVKQVVVAPGKKMKQRIIRRELRRPPVVKRARKRRVERRSC